MNYTPEQIARIKDEIEEVTECALEAEHRNMLNEVYGTVSVCGLDYAAANLLRSTDPVAFRCSFSDYLDSRDDIVEIGGEYYKTDEVDELIEKMEEEEEVC